MPQRCPHSCQFSGLSATVDHSVTVGADDRKIFQLRLHLRGCITKREEVVDLAKSVTQSSVMLVEVEAADFTGEATCGLEDRALFLFDQSPVPFANQVLHEFPATLSAGLRQVQHLRRGLR